MAASSSQLPRGSSSLAELVEKSRKLAENQNGTDLPEIHLGLEQIANQSSRLFARAQRDPSAAYGEGRAHYLLAGAGVNADELSHNITNTNLGAVFEPLQPILDNDIEEFARHEHEQNIIGTIEEGRHQTFQDFYRAQSRGIRRQWEKRKASIFEELGRHAPGSFGQQGVSGSADATMDYLGVPPAPAAIPQNTRSAKYQDAVRRLNQWRKARQAKPILHVMQNASAEASVDPQSAQVTEVWRLLASIVGETSVVNEEFQGEPLTERHFARDYLDFDGEGKVKVGLRKRIREGGRQYLEDQFIKYVEKTIDSRRAEAGLGGAPTKSNTIRAFVQLKLQDNPGVELVNGVPFWARLFHFLRAGYVDEARRFAEENERSLPRPEQAFVTYFKAWSESPDRRLPKSHRDRLLTDWIQRIRYPTADPYKYALYKLIGRVELSSRKTVPKVLLTTEDWLWYQLSLIREAEEEDGGQSAHEFYTLADLANILIKFGEGHFDPGRNRPLLYFQVLLMSGNFERAVAYLWPKMPLEAVHFASALTYYGLLRVPSTQESSDVQLLRIETDPSGKEVPGIHFAKLIHRYVRSLPPGKSAVALQYLYLISLNGDLPDPRGREQIALCHNYITELVIETKAYGELVGSIDEHGVKQPGIIEQDLPLIKVANERDYLLGIVRTAAVRAEHEKRFQQAVMLYNLAEEYDAVLAVVSAELAASLSRGAARTGVRTSPSTPFYRAESDPRDSSDQEDVGSTARAVLEHYTSNSRIAMRVSAKSRQTCEMLLHLREGIQLHEAGKLEQALAVIAGVGLIPLNDDVTTRIRKTEEFKTLDEDIVRNFDTVLLTTMTIISKLHSQLKNSPFADAARMQKLTELRRQGQALVTFAGMLKYRFLGSDLYAQLTRIQVNLV